MNKRLRDHLTEIQRQGFAVVGVTRSKHWWIDSVTPSGRPTLIIVPFSPSDWRTARNFRAQLRRLAQLPALGGLR